MWRSLLLGVVAGLRSQTPTAVLTWAWRSDRLPHGRRGPAVLLDRPALVPLAVTAALGELVVDKLPATPSRLDPGPLGGRLVLGAVAGWAIADAHGRSGAAGAAAGAAGAGLGSWGGARYRSAATDRTDVADAVWALAEDAAAIGLGLLAVRGRPPGLG
ncbi:DUF4126 family protein [Euzebya sp.]|uniref:DUF4126 family protein n=1 Tax=Euzebya sp. TaxID=1971409 RepID=UPI003516BF16